MGWFDFRRGGEPRPPMDLTRFLIITGIAIVLVSIISGILGIWVADFAKVSQQVSLGVLLLVVIAAVIIPFMLIRRQLQGGGLTSKDLIFVMLVIGFVIFLMIVLPNLFNLPKPFSAAHLQLQSFIKP